MIYNHILIRYGEISTKGQNRKKFVAQLRKNIVTALKCIPKYSREIHKRPHVYSLKR